MKLKQILQNTLSVDVGAIWTNTKDIQELAEWGYSTGAKLHLLAGSSVSVGIAKTKDIDTGKEKDVISKDISASFGSGSNSGFGTSYTWIIPLNITDEK